MPDLSSINVNVVLPELILIGFTILIMLFDVVGSEDRPGPLKAIPWLTLTGVVFAGGVCVTFWNQPDVTFQDAAILDPFSLGLRLILYIAAALGILLSVNYIPQITRHVGEYYSLLLLAIVGMSVMGMALDLIVVFLGLEIFSLALYILTGINRRSQRSSEASMKYFLLGAFASTFFVYGAALVYGAAGSTQYDEIAASLAGGMGDLALLYPGIGLLIIGFGFKVSMMPFHMWTPDVYQGAPTPVTAFMSVGTKAAAFAAFVRVLLIALPEQQPVWGWVLAVLAVLTMTLGNFAALRQTSLKRMLAYSSIAHAGYILVALVPGIAQSADAAIFYLFTYAFMNIGAFATVIALEKIADGDALQNRAAGLSKRFPILAFAMAVFMIGLSGVPPLAGFFAKVYVFGTAVQGGWAWLAVIGMLNSVVAAYYYLRVVVAMYCEEPGSDTISAMPSWSALKVGMAVAAAFTVLIGIFPGIWTGLFQMGLGG